MFLYHVVPPGMRGDRLYPLRQLRTKMPDIYRRHMAKYVDRPALPSTRIPPLECGWGDVVFLTAVHPRKLRAALHSCGHTDAAEMRAYEIHVDSIHQLESVVMYDRVGDRYVSYIPFNAIRMSEYDMVPEDTLRHYRLSKLLGQKPFRHQYVPQILYRESIDVSNAQLVTG
jgi:hypothetical protein